MTAGDSAGGGLALGTPTRDLLVLHATTVYVGSVKCKSTAKLVFKSQTKLNGDDMIVTMCEVADCPDVSLKATVIRDISLRNGDACGAFMVLHLVKVGTARKLAASLAILDPLTRACAGDAATVDKQVTHITFFLSVSPSGEVCQKLDSPHQPGTFEVLKKFICSTMYLSRHQMWMSQYNSSNEQKKLKLDLEDHKTMLVFGYREKDRRRFGSELSTLETNDYFLTTGIEIRVRGGGASENGVKQEHDAAIDDSHNGATRKSPRHAGVGAAGTLHKKSPALHLINTTNGQKLSVDPSTPVKEALRANLQRQKQQLMCAEDEMDKLVPVPGSMGPDGDAKPPTPTPAAPTVRSMPARGTKAPKKAPEPIVMEIDDSSDDDEKAKPKACASSAAEGAAEGSASPAPPPAKKPRFAAGTLLIFPRTGKDSVTLHHDDMKGLAHNEMLNDTIIDFYLRLIQYQMCTEEQRSRMHIFTSFFFKRLTERPPSMRVYHKSARGAAERFKWIESNYRAVSKWTKNVDIFSKDYIVIPVVDDMHWYLVVVVRPRLAVVPAAESTEKLDEARRRGASRLDPSTYIIVCDSLADANDTKRRAVVDLVRDYLELELADKKKMEGVLERTGLGALVPSNLPQQGNFYDCGAYLLKYAEMLMTEPPKQEALSSTASWNSWYPHFEFGVRFMRDLITSRIKELAGAEQWAELKKHELAAGRGELTTEAVIDRARRPRRFSEDRDADPHPMIRKRYRSEPPAKKADPIWITEDFEYDDWSDEDEEEFDDEEMDDEEMDDEEMDVEDMNGEGMDDGPGLEEEEEGEGEGDESEEEEEKDKSGGELAEDEEEKMEMEEAAATAAVEGSEDDNSRSL